MQRNLISTAGPGRPPGISSVRATCARHANDAIKVLVDQLTDADASPSDRREAAKMLLAYATADRRKPKE